MMTMLPPLQTGLEKGTEAAGYCLSWWLQMTQRIVNGLSIAHSPIRAGSRWQYRLNVVNLEWFTKLEEDVDPDGAGAGATGAADLSKRK